jgi:hypothetical protein
MKLFLKIIGVVVTIFVSLSVLLFVLTWTGNIQCNLFITVDTIKVTDHFLCPVIEFFLRIWFILSVPFSPFM